MEHFRLAVVVCLEEKERERKDVKEKEKRKKKKKKRNVKKFVSFFFFVEFLIV